MRIRVLLSVLAILMSAAAAVQAGSERLNVIFFLVDDLGQRDVACYGSRFYETAAIDQLAREGMLFQNAYSTCHVCSPSRASILTGKYPARTNLTEWLGGRPERDYEALHHAEKATALPKSERTLATTLQQHGYATANYGKAHLNRDPRTYGFDEATTGWVRSYYAPFSAEYEKTLPSAEGDYFTDRLTDAAIDFIERNRDRPFFVHLEHFSVHDPIQGRRDLVEKYRRKLKAMPKQAGPSFILEPNPDGPVLSADRLQSLRQNDQQLLHQQERVWWVKQKQDNAEFAGMVEATDQSLGRIRDKLKELGLEKNTIIVFTSDNGGMAASNQYRGIQHSPEVLDTRFASSNLPFRGAKGWNYEGGIRVPLIVYWPGETQPGTTSNAVVTGTDFYPTLLSMLNLPAIPEQHVDGRNFVPALRGESYERGPVYWHFPHYSNHGYQSPGGAIRDGRYKLLEYYENGSLQLFDLQTDPGEQNDLAEAQPGLAKRLRAQLQRWREQVDAKMPYPKTATSKPAPGARVGKPTVAANLPADVQQFAAGWSVRDWGGPAMKPGLRKEWGGRNNVLMTHPLSRDQACVLTCEYSVPRDTPGALQFAVNNDPRGDWMLIVRINDQQVLHQDISGSKWQDFQFDLEEYRGRTIRLELENRASGWSFEAGYWSNLSPRDFR